MKKNRVLIIDPASYSINGTSRGHYLAVANNLYNVLKKTFDVKIVGGSIYKSKFENDFILLKHNASNGYNTMRNKIYILLNIRQLFKLINGDTIIWQSSSVVTSYIGIWLFGSRSCKLFMIQYNTKSISSFGTRLLYKMVKHKISGVICTLDKIGQAYALPFCVTPDYIYNNEEKTREIIPYIEREYDFCMVGIICDDKGVVEVAEKMRNTNFKVIIAGKPETVQITDKLHEICDKSHNISMKLEYISDEEYDYYIRNSRYCILNYKAAYSEHTSGVVYDVLFRGTPIIGSNCKAFYFVEKYKVGNIFKTLELWNPDDVLTPILYDEYLENIKSYYLVHKKYAQNLCEFINNF